MQLDGPRRLGPAIMGKAQRDVKASMAPPNTRHPVLASITPPGEKVKGDELGSGACASTSRSPDGGDGSMRNVHAPATLKSSELTGENERAGACR